MAKRIQKNYNKLFIKKIIPCILVVFIALSAHLTYAGSIHVNNNTPNSIQVILSALEFGIQDALSPFSSKIESIPISSGSIFYAAFVTANNGITCQGTMAVNQTLSIYSGSNALNCQV